MDSVTGSDAEWREESEDNRCTKCSPNVETFEVSKNGFYIEAYDDSKVNKELINLAEKYGYEAGVTQWDDIWMIKYWKK